MLAKGSQITDGQAFNYVAKGGKTDEDFVVEDRTPDYTIIEKSANIGIKLPLMKVNTPTETNVEVKYAVTKNGKVFVWPPFPSENAYNIRDKEFVDSALVSSSGDIDITVASSTFKIQINENSRLENRELLDDGLSKKEFEEIASKIKVGDYINYEPIAVQNVETDPTKTESAKQMLSTDENVKWRILSIDSETGKVMITADEAVDSLTFRGVTAYLYGIDELNRLCEKLYSNETQNLVARSMTVEDVNKLCKYIPENESEQIRYVWYPNDILDDDLKDIVIENKKYIAKRHTSNLLNNVKKPRFYTWDDEYGNRVMSSNKESYNEIEKGSYVLITKTWIKYVPSLYNAMIGEILGTKIGWLATRCVYMDGTRDCVGFNMQRAYLDNLDSCYLYYSSGEVAQDSHGLRPVICFSAGLLKSMDMI